MSQETPSDPHHDETPRSAEPAPAEETTVDPIAEAKAEAERYRDLAMRTQADFENFRKRAARDREDAVKSATAALVDRLLPVVDNFELGLQAARGEGGEAILTGLEMIARQFQDFLVNSGIEVIDAEGQVFDHNLHEAIGQEPSDTVPEGSVTRQLRKGYKFRDRLIRAANVVVSKGPQ